MELELKKTSLDAYEAGREVALTQEETAETIVPDYCPDLARIIETTGAVFLHSQELREGTAEISGTVRVSVLYTPDGEGGVRTLEFSIPFSVESDGLPEDGILLAETETEFLETRMLNPRKLYTHVRLATRLTPYRKTVLSFTSGVEAEEALQMERRVEQERGVLLTRLVEREFVFSDEMELSPGRPGAAELLAAQVLPAVTEVKLAAGRAVVKGAFTVSLLYQTEDGVCASASGELPFSQMLDVEGAPEDAAASVRLQLTGMDLQIGNGDPDGRLIEVTLYLRALALVRQERELEVLTDLYSTAYDVRVQAEPLELASRYERLVRRQPVRELLETGAAADAILSLSAVCGPVSVIREDDGVTLRTGATIRVLYLDEGGVPLVSERRAEVSCRLEVPEGDTVTARAVCPEAVQGSLSERGIEVRFPVEFQAETVRPVKKLYVAAAELDTETPRDTEDAPSLVVRRLGAGETAWDLAKACHSTVRDILAANRLTGDIPKDTPLLIPRKRA